MKWVRWDGVDFRISNGEPTVNIFFTEDFINCEKHADWREIESGTLDIETGKLRLVLKPIVPSLRDAWKDFKAAFPYLTDGELDVSKNLEAAINRELNRPSAFG